MGISDLIFSNWRKDYKQASFRGVKFYVRNIDTTLGRKTAVHEFPGRDINFVEDTGRAARTYPIEAYIIGPRYLEDKRKLMNALEKEGEGPLVHPYQGEITVKLLGIVSISESSSEGGMARISMVFSESKEPELLTTALDPIQSLYDTLATAYDKTQAAFEKAFDIFQTPKNVADDVASILSELSVVVSEIRSVGRSAEDFQKSFDGLQNSGLDLAKNASNLFNEIKTLLTSKDSEAEDGISVEFAINDAAEFERLTGIDDTDLTPEERSDIISDNAKTSVSETSKMTDFTTEDFGTKYFGDSAAITKLITDPNTQALTDTIKITSVIAATNEIVNAGFSNKQEASAMIELLQETFDKILNDIEDELYDPLYQLSTVVIQDINQRSLLLPTVLDYKLNEALPSLFVANDLYEDIDRAAEIVKTNNVMHPGFVPGGVTLEVLSRV